jgi:NitT/TauT family transport system permease protein
MRSDSAAPRIQRIGDQGSTPAGSTSGAELNQKINEAKVAAIAAHRRERAAITIGKVAFPLFVLGLWQFASGRWIDPFFVSSPYDVAVRLIDWLADGTILTAALSTLLSATYGFLIGGALGIVLALILGRILWLDEIIRPFLTALYSLPRLALVPLFILWLGIGTQMKIALTSVIVFFIVFYTTYAGVRDVPPSLINVLRTMGATRFMIIRKVILPSAAAFVFTGLQVSVPYAVTGAVFGELIVGSAGLGFILRRAQSNLDSTGVFAGLIVIMCVAGLITFCVSLCQRMSSKWRLQANAPVM